MTEEKYIQAVNDHADSLFRIAYSVCKNRQDAEDSVQNSFMKLFTTQKSFSSDEHMKNYLVKITVNYCKHMFTTPWKKKVVLLEEYNNEDYYTMEDREEHYEVYNAVMSLPQKYRLVVHLYYFEDYSVKEISKLINEKETTIQTRLMRAREKLKVLLKEVWQDEEE
jgi:RNA polymerase sigma-70 factor (ECF subfamily)